MSIGKNIKEIRNKKGLTQDELANKSNLSKNAIWNYENGKRQPNIVILSNIADALGVTVADLLVAERTFTNILIDELNYPISEIYGLTDNLKILSKELNISYNNLEKVVIKNLDLPAQDQYKLLKYLSEIDSSIFATFCEKNRKHIANDKAMNDLYLGNLSDKIINLENSSLLLFKQFLEATFSDKVKEFINENNLQELYEETENFLEFSLFKLEKKYNDEDNEVK